MQTNTNITVNSQLNTKKSISSFDNISWLQSNNILRNSAFLTMSHGHKSLAIKMPTNFVVCAFQFYLHHIIHIC